MSEQFNKIYLASPFFNDMQREVVRTLEVVLSNISKEVYSPSRDGIKLVMKESTLSDRQRVFDSNCYNIDDSSAVVAFMDNSDQGTIWEVGRAVALGIPVVVIIKTENGFTISGIDGQSKLEVDSLDKKESELSISAILYQTQKTLNKKSVIRLIGFQGGEFETKLVEKYSTDHGPVVVQDYLESEVNGDSLVSEMTYGQSMLSDLESTKVILVNIDNRSEQASYILGQLFADPSINYKVVTFSNSDYGLNLMLQHSVSDHYTEINELFNKIDSMLSGDYSVSQAFVKNTDKFE